MNKQSFRFDAKQQKRIIEAVSAEMKFRLSPKYVGKFDTQGPLPFLEAGWESSFLRVLEMDVDLLKHQITTKTGSHRRGRPRKDAEQHFVRQVAVLFEGHLGIEPRTTHHPESKRAGAFSKVVMVCLEAAGLNPPKDPFRLIAPAAKAIRPESTHLHSLLTAAEKRVTHVSASKTKPDVLGLLEKARRKR
jgi:hypothetical protein